jgi:hypothetical protein
VQCTFWARQYAVTPAQLVEWWPDIDLPGRRKQVRQQQWTYQAAFDRWSNRGTQDLRGWTLMLLRGVTLVLTPPQPLGAGNGAPTRH